MEVTWYNTPYLPFMAPEVSLLSSHYAIVSYIIGW